MTGAATTKLISAIVCSSQRYAHLPACLDALLGQSVAQSNREIMVVDNSCDAAARSRFAWPAGVRLVVADRPGLSHARNLGVQAARGTVVAFIDDDALAAPDWLAMILAAFAAAPGIAAVGGPVIPIWPDGGRPAWLETWHDGFLSIVDRGPRARTLAAGEWLAGTNVAFDTAALRTAGPFDERLGRRPGTLLGNEEIALFARLRAAGHGVHYDPRIIVRHRVHAERVTQAWMRRRIAWQAVSDLLLDQESGGFDAASAWQTIATYLEKLPPAYRGVVGLLHDVADPGLFRAQGEAIAGLLHLLAANGEDITRALLAEAA